MHGWKIAIFCTALLMSPSSAQANPGASALARMLGPAGRTVINGAANGAASALVAAALQGFMVGIAEGATRGSSAEDFARMERALRAAVAARAVEHGRRMREISRHRNDYNQVVLINECSTDVSAAVRYQTFDDDWVTVGWWTVKAGEEVRTAIASRGDSLFAYIVGPVINGKGLVWNGHGLPDSQPFQVIPYPFISTDDEDLEDSSKAVVSFRKVVVDPAQRSSGSDLSVTVACAGR